MNGMASSVRSLFQAAMAIFVVTIVIGILNGMGVWSPSHNLLLTHVHAGTLGWITLAVVAAAVLMLAGDGSDESAVRRLAVVTIGATVLYVGAFATTAGIARPIAGTLMLVAIVWVLAWAWRRYAGSARTTAQLGTLLALISLTIGAVLGVLLGLFIARGAIPGMSTETAMAIGGAHPPAMLIGYLILAGAAITHWLLDGPQNKVGRSVMWMLFVAGIIANVAFILDIEPLIPLATLLEVVAIVMLIVHLRRSLVPSSWGTADGLDYARMAVAFLAIGIVLLVYVVQLLLSGQIDPATGQGDMGPLLAFDHAMFIGVMTNALFALIAREARAGTSLLVLWGVNGALAVFLAGLVAGVTVLVRIGAPIMGVLLLVALGMLFTRLNAVRAAPAA